MNNKKYVDQVPILCGRPHDFRPPELKTGTTAQLFKPTLVFLSTFVFKLVTRAKRTDRRKDGQEKIGNY